MPYIYASVSEPLKHRSIRSRAFCLTTTFNIIRDRRYVSTLASVLVNFGNECGVH